MTAQTCIGYPYFSTGHVQLGAHAELGNNATAIGGEAATGRDRSLFGGVNVGYEREHPAGVSTSSDPHGIVFGGRVGYQFPFGNGGRAQVCPIFAGDWGKLTFPGDVKLKRSHVRLGASVGFARHSSSDFHIVPFASFSVAQFSRDVVASGTETTLATDTYFPLTAGVGLHFSKSFMLIADATIPIDLGGYDPFFGLRAVIPLGGSK